MRPPPLYPLHRSLLLRRATRPTNMTPVAMPPEAREFVEAQALSIFTDMTNSGAPFQAALAAIYLSGSENALAASRDTTQEPSA